MQDFGWKAIHNMKQEGLENCLTLIDLLRTLPPTSVKNESSFSIMKLTNGKRRPRMKSSTLNDLLTVSLVSPAVSQFDPAKSIEYFLVMLVISYSLKTYIFLTMLTLHLVKF